MPDGSIVETGISATKPTEAKAPVWKQDAD